MNHTIKARDRGTKLIGSYTRGKAIKLFCTECFAWEGSPEKQCTSETCPLFPYRGKLRAGYESDPGTAPDEPETSPEAPTDLLDIPEDHHQELKAEER